MTDVKPRRKLAAILAADVVGFSKMMGENEDRTLKSLKACRSLTDESKLQTMEEFSAVQVTQSLLNLQVLLMQLLQLLSSREISD